MNEQKQSIGYFVFCYVVVLFICQPLYAEKPMVEPTNKMGALLTLPDILQIDERLPQTKNIKNNKPFLTTPFIYDDKKETTKKIWSHGLPKKKPIKRLNTVSTKTFKEKLAISSSLPKSFIKNDVVLKLKAIPYPSKKPPSVKFRKQVTDIIRTRKVPVVAVTMQELPVPAIPSTLSKFEQLPKSKDKYILFDGDSSVVTKEMEQTLQIITKKLENNQTLRVQLHAFATGRDGNPSSARRISLSRALAVREYFKQKGVRATRMDIRALGDKTTNHPIDRIDFIFVE